MKKIPLSLLFGFYCLFVLGQNKDRSKTNELNLVIDNDILLLIDRYYTAGHEITYRKVARDKSWLNRYFNKEEDSTCKLFSYYRYGNKIFTPRSVRFEDSKLMDRPYAGWSFVDVGITKFKGFNTGFQFEIEMGLVGYLSGMEKLQKWWHKETKYPTPRGWFSQIQNEFVVNVNYHFLQRLKLDNHVDILFNTGLYGGTGSNKISEHVTFRVGNTNALSSSVFFNGRLGARNPEFLDEVFLYFGWGVDYVMSNIFVEGSLFKKHSSPVTAKVIPLLMKQDFGVMHSGENGSFSMGFTFLSKEVLNNLRHGYATINYAVRF